MSKIEAVNESGEVVELDGFDAGERSYVVSMTRLYKIKANSLKEAQQKCDYGEDLEDYYSETLDTYIE